MLECEPEAFVAATGLDGVCDLAKSLSKDLLEMAAPKA